MTEKEIVEPTIDFSQEKVYIHQTDVVAPNLINVMDILLSSRPRRERKSHYPSGARIMTDDGPIGTCLRQQYYSWKGEIEEKEEDVSGLWKMEMGTAIHEWLAKMFKERFPNTIPEYPVKYSGAGLKNPISGRLDNLVPSSDYGTFGIEIKSAYGKGMTNVYAGIKHNGPKIGHLMQALSYMYISKLPAEVKDLYMPVSEEQNRPIAYPELDFFVLFYLARDTAYRIQFYIFLQESQWVLSNLGHLLSEDRKEKIANRKYVPVVTSLNDVYIYEDITFNGLVSSFLDVEYSLENDDIPDRDFKAVLTTDKTGQQIVDRGKSDWQCSYCPFWRKCWNGEGVSTDD